MNRWANVGAGFCRAHGQVTVVLPHETEKGWKCAICGGTATYDKPRRTFRGYKTRKPSIGRPAPKGGRR